MGFLLKYRIDVLASEFQFTFCMLSLISEVLRLPLANLSLSRLATDASPALGFRGDSFSPKNKKVLNLVSDVKLPETELPEVQEVKRLSDIVAVVSKYKLMFLLG